MASEAASDGLGPFTAVGEDPDEASVRAVLRSRAAELAKPPETHDHEARWREIVEFMLGKERYGFRSSFVREVFPLSEITPLPGLPTHLLGVINVRGRILSVMDIRRWLEFGEGGLTNLNKAIILQHEEMELAVLADEVTGVYSIDTEEAQHNVPTLSKKQQEYLKGVSKAGVIVLDAEKLLTAKDLVVRADSQPDRSAQRA